MEILFVTSEVAPLTTIGPAAHVCGALPKAFRGLGHRVTVLSPLYKTIDPMARALARRLSKIEVDVLGRNYSVDVYDGRTSAGVDLVFFGHEQLFGTRRMREDGDDPEVAALRAGVFARAAVAFARQREPQFDVIHGHDWLGALTALHLRRDSLLERLPFVLTVHDPGDPGAFPEHARELVGIDSLDGPGVYHAGRVQALAAGLPSASHVTTVSQAYARELVTGEAKHSLGRAFELLGDRFTGILNGVDASVWNPATDPKLPARFDPTSLGGKERCKAHLQKLVGFPVRNDAALIGAWVVRGEPAGFDLFGRIAQDVLRNDVQVCLSIDPAVEPSLREVFADLSRRYPDRMQLRVAEDETTPHVVLGGADAMVVPARHEPCGFTQMYAHRYASLPIARRVGGTVDTVVDCDHGLETGSGFLYEHPHEEDLLGAIRRQIGAFTQHAKFCAVQRRAMRVDHSWERSARLYERLYRELSMPRFGVEA